MYFSPVQPYCQVANFVFSSGQQSNEQRTKASNKLVPGRRYQNHKSTRAQALRQALSWADKTLTSPLPACSISLTPSNPQRPSAISYTAVSLITINRNGQFVVSYNLKVSAAADGPARRAASRP